MNRHSKHYIKKGRRAKSKGKKIYVFSFIVIIIVIVAFFTIWMFSNTHYEQNLTSIGEITPIVEPKVTKPEENVEIVDVSDMPDQIQGYEVVGKIVIDKIKVESYILSETSDDALKVGVTKFYGPHGINEPGNYCIAGHNYRKVFGYLHELSIGDKFYIVSKDGKKVTYTITKKTSLVKANDMSHIKQDEDGIRKVTLITCDLGGITRFILRAEQKK